MIRRLFVLGLGWMVLTLAFGCEKSDDVTSPGGPGQDVTENVPDSLAIAHSFAPLLADGIAEETVEATVVDAEGRGLAGIGIAFATSHGSITPFATTDAAGRARATLTSAASQADLAATITAAASTAGAPAGLGQAVAVVVSRGPLSPSLRVEAARAAAGHTGIATALGSGIIRDTAVVPMTGITVTLTATPTSIPADGFSSSRLVALVAETTRRVPLDGREVLFGATSGLITGRVVTNGEGVAVATLTGTPGASNAEVTAYFGRTLTARASVAFLPPPSTAEVLLRIDTETLPADGASETRLIATALDAESNPMPNGTPVTFSVVSGEGRIVAPVQLTGEGVAEAVYVAGRTAGVVSLRATSGNASVTSNLILQPLASGEIALSADRASILADGAASALVTAVVTDRFGNPVQPGTQVDFTASEGTLDEVRPTDENGAASVRLRAVRFVTGTARVTASVGNAAQTLDVRFVSEGAAHVEAVGVSPSRIGVRGASDHETATITFEVQDRNGIPVDADHAVTLAFALTGEDVWTDATVYPASATTNPQGRVLATVNSGEISGSVRVDATASGLLSEPIRVAIHGDLPDPAHFSVFSKVLNVPGRVFGLWEYDLCAKVGDHHGNPVPDSTAVWFSADFGLVQGSGFTDDLGDACVTAETGAPFPDEDGFVTITAQTVGKSGALIETSTRVLWSGPSFLLITDPPPGFDVPNGGSVTIDYTLSDDLGNPLVAGTTIKVTSTAGALGGNTDVVLPDTQSQAYTHFSAVLSDDDTETNEPEAVSVTITVTSTNGNRSAFLTGTKH
jgi:hypothetical protein